LEKAKESGVEFESDYEWEKWRDESDRIDAIKREQSRNEYLADQAAREARLAKLNAETAKREKDIEEAVIRSTNQRHDSLARIGLTPDQIMHKFDLEETLEGPNLSAFDREEIKTELRILENSRDENIRRYSGTAPKSPSGGGINRPRNDSYPRM
ncbi:MAG: hypothetical protein Q8O32_02835, partial [bacterium]|nr:hypothetical protein [bacterium]